MSDDLAVAVFHTMVDSADLRHGSTLGFGFLGGVSVDCDDVAANHAVVTPLSIESCFDGPDRRLVSGIVPGSVVIIWVVTKHKSYRY